MTKALLDRWDVRPNVGAERGPAVLVRPAPAAAGDVWHTPDEARELALLLWDAADQAEGAIVGG